MRISLLSSTWIDGVRSANPRNCLSRKLLAAVAAQISRMSRIAALRITSGVIRKPPRLSVIESSPATIGSSSRRMLSAASVHADTATTRLTNWLRITPATMLITTHALARSIATSSR